MANEKLYYTVLKPNKLCYPSYYNTYRRLESIEKRYTDIEEGLDRCTGVGMSLCEPNFFLIEKSVNSGIKRALFPNGKTSKGSKKVIQTKKWSIFADITPNDIVFLPSQVLNEMFDMIHIMGDVMFIIVASKSFKRKQFNIMFKGRLNVKYVKFEKVRDAASIALEKIIFKPIKKRAEILAKNLETYTTTNIKAGQATKGYQTRSKTQDIIAKEFIERLLKEIIGMYNRSKIPIRDRPKISASLKRNVSDKVAQELYGIDLSVKSCGYRFSVLQVFVEDTSNKEINDKIKKVLQNNGILTYDIVPSIGTFKPLLNVGAKCQPHLNAAGYGTVGGFATKSRSDLCALVSRHVAVHSSDGKVLLSNNQRSIQARLIQETVPTEGDNILDISAAIIHKRDANNCDTRFKDEDGDTGPGLDSCYDVNGLDNRHVHTWGASTSPGLGIITMPEIRDRNDDNTYIVVEDRQDGDKAFCKRGDSGAFVCADDINGKGVEVISMVIGEDMEKKGKYATLRLDKGLEQLKRQTSEDFYLCKD